MTDRRFTLLDLATALVAAAILAAAAWVALRGPTGPIPMHFDLQGRPDRWGDRSELAALLGVMAVAAGATGGGLGWYAARTGDPSRRRGLRLGQGLTLAIIAMTTATIGFSTLSGMGEAGSRDLGWATAGTSLLMIIIGAVLGRVPPNPVVGVRTPWNYKSRLAWDRSNRLAGRLFFWLGLAGLISVPFAPGSISLPIFVAAILLAAAWSVFESWRVWRTDPDRQPF
jgi:uncharacterized membrane protein